VITDGIQYDKAREELRYLEAWLERLHDESPGGEKGLTKAGIRKMIARLHEELAVYEGGRQVELSKSP
jgi:hypothetical protein